MSRDLYDALFDGDAAKAHGEDAEWLALFASAGQGWRQWFDGSLALAEFQEGLHVDEAEARADADTGPVLRLAADDRPELSFPARYEDGTWTVIIGLGADGEPYCALEAGPGAGRVVVDGVVVLLEVGAEAPLSGVFVPPFELVVEDLLGVVWRLVGRS